MTVVFVSGSLLLSTVVAAVVVVVVVVVAVIVILPSCSFRSLDATVSYLYELLKVPFFLAILSTLVKSDERYINALEVRFWYLV